ncbi:MAG: conserved rane protein of unknown function [Rhizobium sp.]|nr:conserved rane protein of unknown function [Rhizobium sp.]
MDKGILRYISARPRLFIALAIGIVFYFVFPLARDASTRLLMAWNIAVGCFLVMAFIVMIRSDDEDMQRHAQKTDEGRFAVLLSSMVAAAVSLAAIVIELSRIKDANSADFAFYISLSVATIFVSWSFIQVIFTEHYAHEYYMQTDGGKRMRNKEGSGLSFPGERKPDYIDFLYFTVTIGVANQTADIAIRSRPMRVLVLVHSVISYFFNATILALSINIVSSIL